MKVIERTDAHASGNAWVLSLIKSVSLHLDGKQLNLRIASDPEHDFYVALIKAIIGGQISAMDPAGMSGVQVALVDDPSAPNDLLLTVNWSGFSGPGGGLSGFLGMLGLSRDSANVGDITFHDWRTSQIELAYVQDGMELRVAFENKAGAQLTYDVCGTNIEIADLVISALLLPYVYWRPQVEQRLDKQGRTTSGYWLDGRDIYVHRCDIALSLGYSTISPDRAGGAATDALRELNRSLSETLPPRSLFRYIEALFVKDNDLTPLIGGSASPSLVRGIDIAPGKARFLIFDPADDMSRYLGHGTITAVRKERIRSSLLPPSQSDPGAKKIVHEYAPDNIIEVEIQRDDGQRVRISTLNLVRSILKGEAKIDGVHVVYRDQVWGLVCSQLSQNNAGGAWMGQAQPSSVWMGAELWRNCYLRSNPDTDSANNLDRLPTYDVDFSDALYRNLYDGTFYFVKADLQASGLKHYLYHRAWHLPLEADPKYTGPCTSCELLNGFTAPAGLEWYQIVPTG